MPWCEVDRLALDDAEEVEQPLDRRLDAGDGVAASYCS